jgi:hypothetical protein
MSVVLLAVMPETMGKGFPMVVTDGNTPIPIVKKN